VENRVGPHGGRRGEIGDCLLCYVTDPDGSERLGVGDAKVPHSMVLLSDRGGVSTDIRAGCRNKSRPYGLKGLLDRAQKRKNVCTFRKKAEASRLAGWISSLKSIGAVGEGGGAHTPQNAHTRAVNRAGKKKKNS